MENMMIGEAHRWWQMVVAVIATFAVVSLTYLVAQGYLLRTRRFPPGPRGWPVIGSLLTLGALPQRSLEKLSGQYGPLMFLYLGSIPTLVVSNSEMAEAVLKTNDHIMASRQDIITARQLAWNEPGTITFSPYGQLWRDLRKVCTKELFTAYRTNHFRAIRQRELLAMLQSILEMTQGGNFVSVTDFLFGMTANTITQMMLGKSYWSESGLTSAEATSFFNLIRHMDDVGGELNLADYIPILKPFDLGGHRKRTEAVVNGMDAWLEKFLADSHQQSLETKQDESRANFVDKLLETTVSKGPNQDGERLSMGQIKALLTEMIVAGTDTSATTVVWALAELLKNPSMLTRAQEELDLVVGKNRLVDEDDIPNLKYIQAIVKETFRLHAPAPLLVPHMSTEACEIAGYHIPAKCLIIINTWTIQRDPLVWERPLEFDPDRFLSTKHTVDVTGKNFELLPFGSGRRICPALNLGLLNVHYPLAQMIHTINWALPEDQKPQELDMSESFGLVCPKATPLLVRAEPRLTKDVIYPTYVS